jgi:hypothetical protein
MTFVTLVPEGHTTVAQRFNAGFRCHARRVPKERMNNSRLNRPFGTQGCTTTIPALKRWAILVSSLRHEGAQILVAAPEDGRTPTYRTEWIKNADSHCKGL